jgi:O-antigen ligase
MTLGIVSVALAAVPDVRTMILEPIVGLLGREINLTGRDAVWRAVLEEKVNPIIGTGAYSFWMGDRIEVGISGLRGANEAHNAYLEVYLNVGLVGLALYLAMLASCTRKAVQQLIRGETIQGDRFRLAFVIVTIMYGVTEAVVRQNLIWLGLLLVVSRASLPDSKPCVEATHGGPSPLIRTPPQWRPSAASNRQPIADGTGRNRSFAPPPGARWRPTP